MVCWVHQVRHLRSFLWDFCSLLVPGILLQVFLRYMKSFPCNCCQLDLVNEDEFHLFPFIVYQCITKDLCFWQLKLHQRSSVFVSLINVCLDQISQLVINLYVLVQQISAFVCIRTAAVRILSFWSHVVEWSVRVLLDVGFSHLWSKQPNYL